MASEPSARGTDPAAITARPRQAFRQGHAHLTLRAASGWPHVAQRSRMLALTRELTRPSSTERTCTVTDWGLPGLAKRADVFGVSFQGENACLPQRTRYSY